MHKTIEVQLSPQEAFDDTRFRQILSGKLHIPEDGDLVINPIRRSVDARGKNVVVKVLVEITPAAEAHRIITYQKNYPDVSKADPVIIVGSGPAGLFAAIPAVIAYNYFLTRIRRTAFRMDGVTVELLALLLTKPQPAHAKPQLVSVGVKG